ncbi:hypothetical protein I8748_03805, partial [Nostoc sp. CENA67]|nr:hypothetical protein [Amazonocrinis nigriterrae CENA67]
AALAVAELWSAAVGGKQETKAATINTIPAQKVLEQRIQLCMLHHLLF